MSSFVSIARRVVDFEDGHNITHKTPREAQLLGERTVHVLWAKKHSCLLDFNNAQAAKIARNLISSGSAREAIQSVNASGSANPLEARMYGPGGW